MISTLKWSWGMKSTLNWTPLNPQLNPPQA
jgi:hypothetical protein